MKFFKLLFKNIYIIFSLYFLSILKYKKLKNIYLNTDNFCCIISTNRSGASLLSSLISQNKNVILIDSYFGKKSPEVTTTNAVGHSYGFSESNIWKYLNNISKEIILTQDGYSIWSHPKFISSFYKESSIFENLMKTELKLIMLKKGYSKEKLYLIKDPYNIVRLKLIKKILPNCKIIFNQRNYQDFYKSCFHLWSKNYEKPKLEKDILLHWYLSNVIGIFDSILYFKDILKIYHEDFYDSRTSNINLMKKIEKFLKIKFYLNYDFKEINLKNTFLKTKKQKLEFNKTDIYELAEYEKSN